MEQVPLSRMDFDPIGHYSRPDVFQLQVNEIWSIETFEPEEKTLSPILSVDDTVFSVSFILRKFYKSVCFSSCFNRHNGF